MFSGTQKDICGYRRQTTGDMRYLIRRTFGSVALLFFSTPCVTAQSISGIINVYTPVSDITGCDVTVGSVAGFTAGDKVMLIQMKGAEIDTNNTIAFGEILDYNNAGNYEFCRIASIAGLVVTLEFQPIQGYTISGLVQLIRVPEYTNATVNATLTCQPWNGITGGVLVFIDNATTVMNANIDVSSNGFRGTTFQTTGWISCAASYKEPESSIEALKGESITILPWTMTKGLGASANGGGGGRTDNGGGGASNFGAGGLGGNFGWTGSCDLQALGGNPLSYNNVDDKIFLGGACGDAQRFEGPGTNFGADGGGLVIIRADAITGNSFSIIANGDAAVNTIQDGGGGGGAAGAVLLDIPVYTNVLNVITNGGKGGDATIYTPVSCSGGGGGGGGALWVSTPAVDPNIVFTANAGLGGLSNSSVNGDPGLPGGTITDLEIPESTIDCSAIIPPVVSTEVTDVSCGGTDDGTATIDITGGSPPYTYLWSTGGTTATITGLAPGSYECVYTDAFGVEDSVTVVVGSSGGIFLAVVTQNDPTCFGFTDGSVTVETTGGTAPYDYTWVPTNPVLGATFNNLGDGTVTVSVIDANGCKDTLVITINEPPEIIIDLNLQMPVCFGDQNGYAVVDSVHNAQGDLTNITYIWNPDPPVISGVGADSLYNLGEGTYSLIVNDDFGCSAEITFDIVQPDELVFTELGYEPAFCRLYPYQSGNGVVYASAGGGTPDYTYVWENLATGETHNPTTWGGLNPGDYQITITDDAGCVLTQIVTMDSLNPIADFDVASAELNSILEGTAVVCATFTNQSINFANPNDPLADTTFFWNLNTPEAQWILTHNFFETFDTCYSVGGTYIVCLVAQNKNGCVDTACKTITVFDPLEFGPVNIFTPNDDGINDVFTFIHLAKGVKEFHCVIVNRWGQTLAEINDINVGWDGTDKSGSVCNDGVYFYTYEGKAENSEPFAGQGTIQIVSGK